MKSIFEHQNYWAVILGGSSGLGFASAKKLAAHKMNLCLVYRERKIDLAEFEKLLEQLKCENIEILHFNMDALLPEKRMYVINDLKNKLQATARVKLLLHSISKGNLKPMYDDGNPTLENDDFRQTIDAMAVSLYDWTKDLYKNNLFAGDARVLSFTSEGSSRVLKNYAAVSAAKAALESISRSIALEFAPYGIKANCIQAGVTDTKSFRMIPGSNQLAEFTKSRNPYRRLTTPEDIANAVYLMCLDEAAWINGAIIPVDGGEHIA